MKSAAGLWIDHSQASIVMLSGDEEKTEHITSDMEKHVRYSGARGPMDPGPHWKRINKTGALKTSSAGTTTGSSRSYERRTLF